MSGGTARPRRTLWEEGRHPGPLVVVLSVLVVAGVAALDLAIGSHLSLLFDVVFVLVCTAAALLVRPRDFFPVGVLPPLLMAVTVLVVAVVEPTAFARSTDGTAQAFVSGLARHAGALVLGYALTLVVLALRQVAMRNSGAIRRPHPTSGRSVHPQASYPAPHPEVREARVPDRESGREPGQEPGAIRPADDGQELRRRVR